MTCGRAWRIFVLAGLLTAAAAFAQTVTPSIAFLTPSSAPASSAGFVLNVTGLNFQLGATVYWNGTPLQTTFLGNFQLSATVPASLIPSSATIVAVTVFNPGSTGSNAANFNITAVAVAITTTSLPAATTGSAYSATLTATGGVQPYVWTATTTLPPGLTLNTNGTLSGIPAATGSYTVTVRVADAQGAAASASLALTITRPPLSITTPTALPAGTASQAYTQTLTAIGGTAPYRWTAGQGLPSGLTLNLTTGVISGTPTTAGAYTFPIQLSDSAQGVVNQNFTLTINPPPLAITTIPPLFNGIVGTPYAQTFSASGGAPPYQWSLISGTAGGLTLDTNSGVLQGTPQTTGAFTFTIQVTDSKGARVTQAFTVTVTAPTLSFITGASLPAGSAGVAYSQQFAVVGGTPPYTWSVSGGSLPPGLTFDAVKAILAGTPVQPGPFTFTLLARDSAGATASRSFTLTITPATLTITSPTQLPDSILGAQYIYQMTASGGVLPYTWSANGLPDGLAIDPTTGVITGTLNAASPPAFAVRVIDNVRASATNQFRINVALPQVPSVRISGLPAAAGPAQQFALRIAMDSPFPAAISGQAILTFSPEVGGGDGTIQFSTGGTTASFSIPAGSTDATSSAPLSVQTGTVAGTITISLRLNAGGQDVTPTPAPAATTHIDQAAPVIRSATVTRSGNGLSIQIVGYSTAREVTQAAFTFSATSGQTLQPSASQVTVSVDTLFATWFQSPANNAYGSQFVFTQPFSIQGDVSAVIPQSVTLTNRRGTVTANISQ